MSPLSVPARGLSCAIHVAGPDFRVLILEKNPRPGVKLNISGTGQCNITHDGDIRTFFSRYGSHGLFLKPALLSFPNQALIRFFAERGLPVETTKEGKIFPASRSARDVCDILVQECKDRGVVLQCSEPVKQIGYTKTGFAIHTTDREFFSKNLVLATGGASYPGTDLPGTATGWRRLWVI